VNSRQRESVCKYLYDLSKGILLAGVISYVAGDAALWALLLDFAVAAQTF